MSIQCKVLIYIEVKLTALIFLEASIHSYLFVKGLYPPEAFVSRNLFGLSIKSAAENSLKSYIHSFIKNIEEIFNKGIIHAISLLITKNKTLTEELTIKLDWIMRIYSLSDNDKIVSTSEIEEIFASVLLDIYQQEHAVNSDCSWQIVVETIKEEASDSEEVLSANNWKLVNKDFGVCVKNKVAEGIINIEWGFR